MLQGHIQTYLNAIFQPRPEDNEAAKIRFLKKSQKNKKGSAETLQKSGHPNDFFAKNQIQHHPYC